MRTILLLLVMLLSIASCKKNTQEKNIKKGAFDYLIGNWERTNEKEGVQTYEYWEAASSGMYKGHGYTLQSKDTIWQERMQLYKKDTLWQLDITGPNESPTIFKLTSHDQNSFVAENPTHDFPTTITYRYFDDTITAIVSNDEMEIPFIFWRAENE